MIEIIGHRQHHIVAALRHRHDGGAKRLVAARSDADILRVDVAAIIRRHMLRQGAAKLRNAMDVRIEMDVGIPGQASDFGLQGLRRGIARNRLAKIEQRPVALAGPHPGHGLGNGRRFNPKIAGDTERDMEANSLQLGGLSVCRYRLGFSSNLRH